jgi:hypothetical protein
MHFFHPYTYIYLPSRGHAIYCWPDKNCAVNHRGYTKGAFSFFFKRFNFFSTSPSNFVSSFFFAGSYDKKTFFFNGSFNKSTTSVACARAHFNRRVASIYSKKKINKTTSKVVVRSVILIACSSPRPLPSDCAGHGGSRRVSAAA